MHYKLQLIHFTEMQNWNLKTRTKITLLLMLYRIDWRWRRQVSYTARRVYTDRWSRLFDPVKKRLPGEIQVTEMTYCVSSGTVHSALSLRQASYTVRDAVPAARRHVICGNGDEMPLVYDVGCGHKTCHCLGQQYQSGWLLSKKNQSVLSPCRFH